MNTAIQEELEVGEVPSDEDVSLVTWAEKAEEGGLSLAQEGLRQLVTITSALLAGSAALLGQVPAPIACKALGAFLLMISLGFALFGAIPQTVQFDIRCPAQIKAARERSIRRKMWCLRLASLALACAFFLLLGGVLAVWIW